MRNIKLYKNMGFIVSTVLLIVVLLLTILTYVGFPTTNQLFRWATLHHLEIMIVMVVVAIIFGFVWSSIFYSEAEKQRKGSKNILDVLLLFLSREERHIIQFLIKSNGETTQAEISRLEGMSRVKAFRILQKMQTEQLIEIIPHGKVRKIKLKDNIMAILREE